MPGCGFQTKWMSTHLYSVHKFKRKTGKMKAACSAATSTRRSHIPDPSHDLVEYINRRTTGRASALLKKFNDYLKALGGNAGTERRRRETMRQLIVMWKFITGNEGSMQIDHLLLLGNVCAFRDHALKTLTHSTVYGYLGTLLRFANYLTRYKNTNERATTVIKDLQLSMKSIKGDAKKSTVKRNHEQQGRQKPSLTLRITLLIALRGGKDVQRTPLIYP